MKKISTLLVYLLLNGCVVGPDFTTPRGKITGELNVVNEKGTFVYKMPVPSGDWFTTLPVWMWKSGSSDKNFILDEASKDNIGKGIVNIFLTSWQDSIYDQGTCKYVNYLASKPLIGNSQEKHKQVFLQDLKTERVGLEVDDSVVSSMRCLRVLDHKKLFYICPGMLDNIFTVAQITLQMNTYAEFGVEVAQQRRERFTTATDKAVSAIQFSKDFTQIIPTEISSRCRN